MIGRKHVRLIVACMAWTAALSGLVFVGGAQKAAASHATPHTCASPPNDPVSLYGRDELCGYFLNRPYIETTSTDGIGLLTGVPDNLVGNFTAFDGVDNIDRFVSVVRYHLQNCNASPGLSSRRRNAAAFIILTMQGAPAGTSANGACTGGYNVNNWENLVRQYASAGLINFNHVRTYQQNTLMHTAFDDPNWYHNSTISHVAGDTQIATSITVYAPNGTILYSIKKDCANPIGIPGRLVNIAIEVQGRVYNVDTGVAYSGVRIESCDGDASVDATTDAFGIFRFTRMAGQDYCVRVVGGGPGGYIRGPYIRPWVEGYASCAGFSGTARSPNFCTTPASYECQIAGGDRGGCFSLDRVADGGYDFVYDTPPPPTCTSMLVTPSSPEVGQSFDVGFTFTIAAVGNSVAYSVQFVNSTLNYAGPRTMNGTIPPGSTTGSVEYQDLSANAAGYYEGEFRVTGSGFSLTCPFNIAPGDLPPIPIVAKPYSRVWGGDVQAGLGFPSGLGCDTAPLGRFLGFNRGSNPYVGTGAQLAVFALGTIEEFVSGQARNMSQPKALTFGNFGAGPANRNPASPYGGGLGGDNVVCASNYYAHANGNAPPGGVVNTWPSGSYRSGSIQLSATAPLTHGSERTLYVNGDAFINSNITFDTATAYANQSQVPVFRLIVRGNIYVAPNVTQLDGIFVAQPSSATTGRFYSCGSSVLWGGNTPQNVPNTGQIIGSCNQRLSVFGAVLAHSLKLLRTNGSLSQSTEAETYTADNNPATPDGNPAEVFIFSPEVWLGGDLQGNGGEFDYVTTLPPVL